VITNSLNAALKLAAMAAGRSARNEVILLGGRTDPEVQATYGDCTVGEIHRYRADVALLSPVGISVHSKSRAMHPRPSRAKGMIAGQLRPQHTCRRRASIQTRLSPNGCVTLCNATGRYSTWCCIFSCALLRKACRRTAQVRRSWTRRPCTLAQSLSSTDSAPV
jgi:hypothetical protein